MAISNRTVCSNGFGAPELGADLLSLISVGRDGSKTRNLHPSSSLLLVLWSVGSPPTLTDLTDSEVQNLQAGQTFVAKFPAVVLIFRLCRTAGS